MRIWRLAVMVAVAMAVLGTAGWRLGTREPLLRLAEGGRADLALASDRLGGVLDRYRDLPRVLAAHPIVAEGPGANAFLADMVDKTGALDIYVLDETATVVAASNYNLPRSFMGQNYFWRPYFQNAVSEGSGFYHAVGTQSDQRGFYFSALAGSGHVVVVKVNVEVLEKGWQEEREVVFFSDSNGVVFLANRPALVLRLLGGMPDLSDPRQYAERSLAPLPEGRERQEAGLTLRDGGGLEGLPERAIWLMGPTGEPGFSAHVLIDTAPARRQGMEWGLLGAAIAGIGGLIAAVMMLRRQALTDRLDVEAAANARLEGEVARRTAELSEVNTSLRGEIAERLAAEAALKEVQAELVQAGKLKALGEMSAGISHELNQPLMAIQSLADNAEVLLDRGRESEAKETLGRIGQIAGRMGRIIRNLRAFARKEGEAMDEVDLVATVQDALSLADNRLRATETQVKFVPHGQVMVQGGRVRLGQVVLNLLSNAMDAMEGQNERRIRIAIRHEGRRVLLEVADCGPGLTASGDVFDPFYTTKPVGKGLGLGLSISYGIVQSFGGKISGRNGERGAVFTVELAAGGAGEVAAE
ncbi:sensor histidine kinase [Algicella marina]|uniref:C4-dicarboxylate transport sensor protein DctB n=1 Tax=Algicella marina TaxID=2683284 RepID=A0A6P1SWD6_9RHOB|nr:ATP-binding protein [Algicella marina]QHQ34984.1 sensor histidine kinase [Algicella marina]